MFFIYSCNLNCVTPATGSEFFLLIFVKFIALTYIFLGFPLFFHLKALFGLNGLALMFYRLIKILFCRFTDKRWLIFKMKILKGSLCCKISNFYSFIAKIYFRQQFLWHFLGSMGVFIVVVELMIAQ